MYNYSNMPYQREVAYCHAGVAIEIKRESLEDPITMKVGKTKEFVVDPAQLDNIRGNNTYHEESAVVELTNNANRCVPQIDGHVGLCPDCVLMKIAVNR